jgi:hypothetical protein
MAKFGARLLGAMAFIGRTVWRGLAETFVEAYAGNSLRAFALFHLRLIGVAGVVWLCGLAAVTAWDLADQRDEIAAARRERSLDSFERFERFPDLELD